MISFIHNNIIWLTPVVTVILTGLIKISAKPEFVTLGYIDYIDFGFDMCIASMIILLTGNRDELGVWLLLFLFILVMITAIIVSRVGWNRETKLIRLVGVILPDIVGTFLLVFVTLYIGGRIQ